MANLPRSVNKLPEIYFRMSDEQKIKIEKSRSLDSWFAIENLKGHRWEYSELRNQGHKVRDDLKLSYKWRTELHGREFETKVNLSGQSRDITLLRYPISTFLFRRAGFEMPELRFVNLFINELWQGPYLDLELVDHVYLKRRSMPLGALFKAQYRAELTLENDVKMSQAFVQKTLDPTEADMQSVFRLEELARVLDEGIVEDTLALSRVLNIENAICYLAVSKLIQNNDGIRNNFYLYLNPKNEKFEFIPWDLDETFRSANVQKIYENNLFEQLEARADFSFRIFKKMKEVWQEDLILGELGRLNDSMGHFAKAQSQYFLNPEEQHKNNVNSIESFIEKVSLELGKTSTIVKN
ncbi:CotH kinase family protein [Fibrobacterales bacterium]|nr:CotH kinase family protein [Fibrobacterales bacterium]